MTLPRMTVETALPDSLHLALKNDRLVIFVGAGISAAPPSSLPDFYQLTERIANDLSHPEMVNRNTPTDVSLGRLDGLNGGRGQVKERARELLRRNRPRHNQLHLLIAELSLVATPRIITTNFDTNLERAFKHLHMPVERFIAPALPQGDDFSGIVHLHGQLESRPHEAFVLTDSDFGKAYITRAWASQFLTRVFQNYEVVFLGYSGADAVVRYLTTGLPPETDAYAIIADEAESPWEGTRVKLVRYPYDLAHSQLPVLLTSWLELASASASDRVTRLRAIVANGPSQNTLDESYLEWAASDPEMVGYFCEAAPVADWLTWVNEHGLLDGMFAVTSVETDGPRWVWARWLAELVADDDPGDFLRLLSSSGSQLSHALWLTIWFKLINDWDKIASHGKWVLLLANNCPRHEVERLATLLGKLADLDPKLAIVIFVELVQLRVSLAVDIAWDVDLPPRVSTEVTINAGDHALAEAWPKLAPSLTTEGPWIADRMISELEKTGLQQFAFAGSPERWGGSRFYRSTIDDRSAFHRTDTINLFIDMARDALRSSSLHCSIDRFDRFLSSENSIVRRLALDAIAHAEALSADESLLAIIRHDLFFWFEGRAEFIAVANRFISTATEAAVNQLCAAMVSESPATEPLLVKEALDFMTWFLSKRPGDKTIERAISQLMLLDPAYVADEGRDLMAAHSVGGARFVEHTEEKSSDYLWSRTPGEVIADMHTQSSDPWDSKGWFANLALSVSLHPDWAWELIRLLADRNDWDGRTWDAILRGLDAQKARPDLIAIANLLQRAPAMSAFAYSLSLLVDHDRAQAVDRPPAEQAEIARALWRCWRASEQAAPVGSQNDGDEWSVMSPRGTLARLVVRAIGDAVVSSEKPQEGLSDWHLELLEMLASAGETADPTLSVLTGDLAWFLYRDPTWTEAAILPKFEWGHNELFARKAWGGFIAYGRWSLPAEEALSDRFKNALPYIQAVMPQSIDRFLQHHAYLFLNRERDQNDVQWTDPFIRDASDGIRAKWTDAVAFSLGAQDEVSEQQWHRLTSYWSRRNEGLPLPFEGEESFALLRWLELAGVDFEVASSLFLAGPPLPNLGVQMDYRYDLTQLPWDTNGASSALVATKVLKSCTGAPWNSGAEIQCALKVAEGGHGMEAIQFLDELVRLGVPAAQTAIEQIRASN